MSGEQGTGAVAGHITAAASAFEEATINEVPVEVRDAARRAFASRDRGAQVLDLESDSLLGPGPVDGPRQLLFGSAPGPQVHVTVLAADRDQVQLEIANDAPGFQLLEVRCGDQTAPFAAGGGPHRTAGPVGHGLLTVVLALGDKRFQTAALRV